MHEDKVPTDSTASIFMQPGTCFTRRMVTMVCQSVNTRKKKTSPRLRFGWNQGLVVGVVGRVIWGG